MGTESIDLFTLELAESHPFSKQINNITARVREGARAASINSLQDYLNWSNRFEQIVLESFRDPSDDKTAAIGRFLLERPSMIWIYVAWGKIARTVNLLAKPNETFAANKTRRHQDGWVGKTNLEVAAIMLMDAYDCGWKSELELARERARAPSAKGGKAAARKWEPSKRMAEEIASEAWSDNVNDIITTGKLAESILKAIS